MLLPTLHTRQLVLRPFTLADAGDVQRLAGARDVAEMTLLVPHPYEQGMAETWIATHAERFARGEGIDLAVTVCATGELAGAIGLTFNPSHLRAELGYWIGAPFRRRGYATEAARKMIEYGFETAGLHRICAQCFSRNTASARVLTRAGMVYEGRLRQHILKWGVFEDIDLFGIVRDDGRSEISSSS